MRKRPSGGGQSDWWETQVIAHADRGHTTSPPSGSQRVAFASSYCLTASPRLKWNHQVYPKARVALPGSSSQSGETRGVSWPSFAMRSTTHPNAEAGFVDIELIWESVLTPRLSESALPSSSCEMNLIGDQFPSRWLLTAGRQDRAKGRLRAVPGRSASLIALLPGEGVNGPSSSVASANLAR